MGFNKRIKYILLGFIALLVFAGGLIYFSWVREQGSGIRDKASGIKSLGSIPTKEPTEYLEATLFFSDPENNFLIDEQRKIPKRNNKIDYAEELINALIEGPEAQRANRRIGESVNRRVGDYKVYNPTLPKNTILKNAFIDNNVVYLNFGQELIEKHTGGSSSELITIYSIVNTIIYNVKGIESVQILVNDEEITTLAGHIDSRRPFLPDWGMVRSEKMRR